MSQVICVCGTNNWTEYYERCVECSAYKRDVIALRPNTLYHVIDNQTEAVVAKRQTLRAAHRRADKLDLQYGAVRYIVKRIH